MGGVSPRWPYFEEIYRQWSNGQGQTDCSTIARRRPQTAISICVCLIRFWCTRFTLFGGSITKDYSHLVPKMAPLNGSTRRNGGHHCCTIGGRTDDTDDFKYVPQCRKQC